MKRPSRTADLTEAQSTDAPPAPLTLATAAAASSSSAVAASSSAAAAPSSSAAPPISGDAMTDVTSATSSSSSVHAAAAVVDAVADDNPSIEDEPMADAAASSSAAEPHLPPASGEPRLFDAGPTQPKRRVELYRDALHSFYGFLALTELALACRISKAWYAAAASLKPRRETLAQMWCEQIFYLTESPLRRHISGVAVDLRPTEVSFLPFILDRIKSAMPHLSELGFSVPKRGRMLPLRLPSTLTKLTLRFEDEADDAHLRENVPSSIMRQVVADCPLLETVDVTPLSAAVIAPLALLKHLTRLESAHEDRLTNEEIDAIRNISTLRAFGCLNDVWTSSTLARSVRDGETPILPIEKLGQMKVIDENDVASLSKLPTLTELSRIRLFIADPAPLLSALPGLCKLDIICDDSVDIKCAVAGLQRCIGLTRLTIGHPLLTDAHLADVLPSLPLLNFLTLEQCSAVTSLSFLAKTPHLSRTLRFFELRLCRSILPQELEHLRSLKALEWLDIINSLTGPLDDHVRGSMRPGSDSFVREFWPKLRDCIYLY